MRVYKSMALWTQFLSVELRIGNVNKAGSNLHQFTENRLIGDSGPVEYARFHNYEVSPWAVGRYLTLQCTMAEFLSFEEIYVYQPKR